MLHLIPEKIASRGLLLLFTLTILFHLLIVSGVIPLNVVWGGRIKDTREMYSFEVVSIALNILMLTVVLIRSGHVAVRLNSRVIRVLLWIMTALFALNTIGNFLSFNETEKLIFTPLTLMLTILCARLAISGEKRNG